MYNHAARLQDHLLIIHGMQDDVVLFRDSIALIEQLMPMGKDFDSAIAPSAVHGWSQKDYYADPPPAVASVGPLPTPAA